MSTVDELLDSIFDGRMSALQVEFGGWVRESRRFKAFATTYRDKIRTKLKNVRDEAGLMDVWAELETAAVLLREARFTLEYEIYTASKQRGPDFTVTFKTHTPFNVEVRRLRSSELEDDPEARAGKLMAVLCDKVGQMPPGVINFVWLRADLAFPEAELNRAAVRLRQMAERKTEDYFTRRGFESAAHFLRRYQHLSGTVLHQPGENAVWMNPTARHNPPAELVRALQGLQTG